MFFSKNGKFVTMITESLAPAMAYMDHMLFLKSMTAAGQIAQHLVRMLGRYHFVIGRGNGAVRSN